MKTQKGFALLEILVSLVLLGTAGVMFLQGAISSSNAKTQNDERSAAKVLAQSIMDTVKKSAYASSYSATIPAEYPGYTAQVNADPLDSSDIQKITVVILHNNHQILTLENIKVDRIEQ